MTQVELKTFLEELVKKPEYQTRDITGDGKADTFCNRSLREAALKFGCQDFTETDNANKQVSIMKEKWQTVDSWLAVKHALDGGLAVAGKQYEIHGHVACIYPGPMDWSGFWGRFVPMIANVGKTNGIMKVSMAFPVKEGEPEYFIFKEVL